MNNAIETVLVPPSRDLGSFAVRRALPDRVRPMVGPFVFWDQAGPAAIVPGRGIDVRPHPHIGLATLTWLFEGALIHRDSLGVIQRIEPGAVNLMTAGRGVADSERSPLELRETGAPLFAVQAWLALPRTHEETDPRFQHVATSEVARGQDGAIDISVVAGSFMGLDGSLNFPWPVLFADLHIESSGRLAVPPLAEEQAIHVVAGEIMVGHQHFAAGTMIVMGRAASVDLCAGARGARIMLLGGATMDGPRHLWWNFVSSKSERIHRAAHDWVHNRDNAFGRIVSDHNEFIPLPDMALP